MATNGKPIASTPDDTFVPEFLNYNTLGIRPVKSVFNLDCETIMRVIRDIASREIDGIQEVTYQHDPKTGTVCWFIWFDSNSDHFVDKTTANTAIGRSISRYSPKFQEFARKFGWNEADDDPEHGSSKVNIGRVVGKNSNNELNRRLTFLQVAIIPFMSILFDIGGNAFQKEFNRNAPNTRLYIKYQWKKGSGEDYHTLIGMQVEKYLPNANRDHRKPHAAKSGNFN